MGVSNRRSRRLVLVDIENVCGGEWNARFEDVGGRVEEQLGLLEHDHVVVAACTRTYCSIGWGKGSWRFLARNGADGADLALLEVIESESVAERFDSVVIVSGDHIFTQAVAGLTRRGVHVTVLARPGGLAASLRLAAHEVLWLKPAIDEAWASLLKCVAEASFDHGRIAA